MLNFCILIAKPAVQCVATNIILWHDSMHGEARFWSTRENLAYLSSVAEILVDELATNQPTRKVEKPFEAALACQLNLLNERSSNCKLNVLEDAILEEIQITTLQSESFSTYNRFCWIFCRTVEELQAKRKSNIAGNLTVSNGGHLENKAEDWKLIHERIFMGHGMEISSIDFAIFGVGNVSFQYFSFKIKTTEFERVFL